MSVQQMLLGGSPSGYNIDRSLRFRASASAYLNRTPASAGNRKTWTWSAWVKRGTLGSNQVLFISKPSGGTDATFTTIGFTSTNTLLVSGLSVQWKNTTQVFRDPSAWYHIVITWDTTQATASNRVRVYVNGSQVTAFGTTFDPSLNFDGAINQADVHALCAADGYSSGYFDGYLAEVNFIDGQALTPASFGSTNALTGVWQPARYTGTYGTNGFYLPFTNTSSVAALGTDFSGNGNTWTVNNISLTAGVTYDSMTDVPTLTNATTANYAVLNPLTKAPNSTLVDGNLLIANNTTSIENIRATMPTCATLSYWECVATTVTSSVRVQFGGILSANAQSVPNNVDIAGSGPTGTFGAWFDSGMKFFVNGSQVGSTYGSTTLTGLEIIMFAHDSSTGKVWMGLNGVWYNSGNPAAGTGQVATLTAGTVFPAVMVNGSAGNNRVTANFGQRPFTYTPPTGFVALNTFNLPTATILKGNTVMDATLYTGNGSTQTITNAAGFQPDLVWVKSRSNATSHELTDSVRGVTKSLSSESDAVEATDTQGLTAFNSNGFTLGTDANYNGSARTFVAWQWKANGTAVSNTSGTITSQVNANPTAGFSIVTYTGNGTAGATIGHGLGVAPSVVIYKIRSASVLWVSYYKTLGATGFLSWSRNIAFTVDSTVFNNTAPTSSVLSVGTSGGTNSNTNTYVAYCFSPIDGYSAFLQYTGNGSTDGTFVYCGFKPKYIMIKRSDSTPEWYIEDAARNPSNPTGLNLYTNLANAEANDTPIFDFLSNGFKLRTSATALNASGGIYQCMVFAENPFKNSLAR